MTFPPSSFLHANTDFADMETAFGFQRVKPGQKQQKVDDVFHKVAKRYDLMNDLMSGCLHRLWKDALVSMLAPPRHKPCHVLDVAGGTGDIAFRILDRAGEKAYVTVCDTNTSMLAVGAARAKKAGVSEQLSFREGNAENLPFEDACFDAYTIAFGMRNVPRFSRALEEAHRVLKRGGRFLCLEFFKVEEPLLAALYDAYSFNVIPFLGEVIAQDRKSYQYLVESIRTFPSQSCFSELVSKAGFQRVMYRNVTGGVAAIHSGWKL